jgi:hypothetical protein
MGKRRDKKIKYSKKLTEKVEFLVFSFILVSLSFFGFGMKSINFKLSLLFVFE